MQQIPISKYFFVALPLLFTYLTGCSGISGLEKRAEQGDATAQYQYAFYLQSEKHDLVKARRWYELSAKQGNTYAQNNLNLPPFADVTVKDNAQTVINPTTAQPQLSFSNDLTRKTTTNQTTKNTEVVGRSTCIEGDCINGKGTYIYDDGSKYIGEYKNGKSHGKGTMIYLDGEKYVGEYQNDLRNGKGSQTFANGDQDIGEFKDGEFINSDKAIEAVKCIKGNCINGQGVMQIEGNKYIGEFKDGTKDGQGTYFYSNGSQYIGKWKSNDLLAGSLHISPDGSSSVTKKLLFFKIPTLEDLRDKEKIERQKEYRREYYSNEISNFLDAEAEDANERRRRAQEIIYDH